MKTLIKKLKALRITQYIRDTFKHDCFMNEKIVSASYIKDGDTGVIFSTGKEYCCKKCDKLWSE